MNPVDFRDTIEIERCLSFAVVSLVFAAVVVNFLTIGLAIIMAI